MRIFTDCICFTLCITCLLVTTAFISPLRAVEKPIGVTIRPVSTYRADLFWFYPGCNDSTMFYDDGSSEDPMAVIDDDRDNRIAVRFDFSSDPALIVGGWLYVLEYDPEPDLPGDPTSPVEVSLLADIDSLPGAELAGPDTVNASGAFHEGGEWVHTDLSHLCEGDNPIWLQVRWPSTNPFVPKLGGDAGSPDYMSFVGYSSDGSDVWLVIPDYDVMLRLELLMNTKDVPMAPESAVVDSFRVYSRDRLSPYPADDWYDTSTSGHILHQRVKTERIDNYYCVTAWLDGVESDCSEPVHITGASGPSAHVSVKPRNAEIAIRPDADTVIYIELKNMDETALNYEFGLTGPGNGIPITLINRSGSLDPLETDSVGLAMYSSQLPVGQYWESGSIDFWDGSEIYLPVDVSIHLVIDENTPADEIEELRPERFTMHQNFPNPFNSETTIIIEGVTSLKTPQLDIFDLLGRKINEISHLNSTQSTLIFQWDGRDRSGEPCPSGLYFYRVSECNDQMRKMLLLK